MKWQRIISEILIQKIWIFRNSQIEALISSQTLLSIESDEQCQTAELLGTDISAATGLAKVTANGQFFIFILS
jgi:hypothetical protein